MIDYLINPVYMGGVVKEVTEDTVKVHLHGRLGVISVSRSLILGEPEVRPGLKIQFYFSYLQVNEHPYDYDSAAVSREFEQSPCLIGGRITEVNDTAVKAEMIGVPGTVAVPRRWVFTPVTLKEGQVVEFYFSCLKAEDGGRESMDCCCGETKTDRRYR